MKQFNYLEQNNFNWVGYRFMKGYDYDTKRELSQKEIAEKPRYEVIEFFIDSIVDNVNPLLREKLLINPIDEPLLSHVFKENQIKEITLNQQETISNAIETKARGNYIIRVNHQNNPVFGFFIKVPAETKGPPSRYIMQIMPPVVSLGLWCKCVISCFNL